MLQNDLRLLVNDYGQVVTYRVKTAGTYNPATGTVASTVTDYSVKVYLYNYSLTASANESIIFGDRRAVFPIYDTSGAAVIEPSVGDQIVGQGDTVSVVSVEKVFDRGVVTCYLCQVRE